MNRMERFCALCDNYLGAVPDEDGPWNTSGEEDAAEYIYGERELERYCLVTVGGEWIYLYPEIELLDNAWQHIEDRCGDSTFGEGPFKIVDLDTGVEYFPSWRSLLWQAPISPQLRTGKEK